MDRAPESPSPASGRPGWMIPGTAHRAYPHITASIKGRQMAKKKHEKKRQAEVQVPAAARPEPMRGWRPMLGRPRR